MGDKIPTRLPDLPDPPSLKKPETLDDDTDDFLGDLPDWGEAANGMADEIEAVADQVEQDAADADGARSVALAAGNFKGNWSDQTGAATVPASYYHSGTAKYWMLTEDTADITLEVPGVSSKLAEIKLAVDFDPYPDIFMMGGF